MTPTPSSASNKAKVLDRGWTDIFPEHILPSLNIDDLARLCCTSRQLLEMAGQALYGQSDGVPVRKERSNHNAADPSYYHYLLGGVDSPQPTSSSPGGEPLPNHPLSLSPKKLEQLSYVKHLIYITDEPRQFDMVDSSTLFPHLRTLTLQSYDVFHPNYEFPFLSNLQPRVIRLTHLDNLPMGLVTNIHPFAETFHGLQHIILHFIRCDPILAFKATWPDGLKQLDILFGKPTPTRKVDIHKGLPHLPMHIKPVCMSSKLYEHWSKMLCLYLVTANVDRGVHVRVIGLGGGMSRDGRVGDRLEVEGQEQGAGFSQTLRRTMEEQLQKVYQFKKHSMSTKARKKWKKGIQDKVDGLEFVGLVDYGREQDFSPL